MTEPTTVNIGLIVPNTGDLPGSWGTTAINPNMSALDGKLAGVQSFSFSGATTFALTNSGASLTPGAGPNQSDNALLKFTGTLSGNSVVQFTVPGFYIVDNRCTVGAFYIQLAPSAGGGNVIGAPPGRKAHVYYDGTDMDYVDMPEVGAALDLHNFSALPPWMTACTVKPYLIKDGQTYSATAYPTLSAILGSTYGGNGITTFGVPDERSRMRLPVDTSGPGSFAGRVTAAGSGINGTTLGASGGSEFLQQHNHTVTDPGHLHTLAESIFGAGGGGFNAFQPSGGPQTTNSTTTGITLGAAGAGAAQNMVPTIVDFLPLIKT